MNLSKLAHDHHAQGARNLQRHQSLAIIVWNQAIELFPGSVTAESTGGLLLGRRSQIICSKHEMNRDFVRRRNTACITKVDLVEALHTGIIKGAMPKEPRVGLGRRPKQMGRKAFELVKALHKLRGRSANCNQVARYSRGDGPIRRHILQRSKGWLVDRRVDRSTAGGKMRRRMVGRLLP